MKIASYINRFIIKGGKIMKEKIKKWLDKLSSANQETFGTGRMDCCELNRKPAPVKKGKAVPKPVQKGKAVPKSK